MFVLQNFAGFCQTSTWIHSRFSWSSFLLAVRSKPLSPSVWSSFHPREMPPSSSSEFYPQFRRKASHLFHPDCQAEILLQILFTPSREALLSRILWPTKVRWTGGEDRQTSGSKARKRFWRAGGRGAELLTCLWLKLDTPMDLVSPASLHFSRAWKGGVVNNYMEWQSKNKCWETSVITIIHQELALIFKKKKVEKVMTQEELLSPP